MDQRFSTERWLESHPTDTAPALKLSPPDIILQIRKSKTRVNWTLSAYRASSIRTRSKIQFSPSGTFSKQNPARRCFKEHQGWIFFGESRFRNRSRMGSGYPEGLARISWAQPAILCFLTILSVFNGLCFFLSF